SMTGAVVVGDGRAVSSGTSAGVGVSAVGAGQRREPCVRSRERLDGFRPRRCHSAGYRHRGSRGDGRLRGCVRPSPEVNAELGVIHTPTPYPAGTKMVSNWAEARLAPRVMAI